MSEVEVEVEVEDKDKDKDKVSLHRGYEEGWAGQEENKGAAVWLRCFQPLVISPVPGVPGTPANTARVPRGSEVTAAPGGPNH